MKRRVLFSEETPGGGGPGEKRTEPKDPPGESPGTPPPGNPPTAAKIVVEATKTERELALEQELEAERSGRKKDQTRVSELEDENRQLKTPRTDPKPKAKQYNGAAFDALGWND